MGLARWEPFTELRKMREDMDRLFENMTRPLAAVPMAEGMMMPAVDVFEKDNNVMVRANLPGLKKEEIDITATEESITLSGEYKREEEVKEESFLRRERQMGRFSRTVSMPAAIKPDDVKAVFRDGVLEITAPKSEEARAKEKKVSIES
jgi:HSP20 family protein